MKRGDGETIKIVMCGSYKVSFIVKFNLFVFKLPEIVVELDER